MEEYTPEIITIVDEEGTEHPFELLDRIETETGKYAALIPFIEDENENDDADELIILRVIEEDDEVYLEPIEDDNEFNEIGDIFEERLSEKFLFEEDVE